MQSLPAGCLQRTDTGPPGFATTQEPVGVVGQIIPWNFPLLMACKALPLPCAPVASVAKALPFLALRLPCQSDSPRFGRFWLRIIFKKADEQLPQQQQQQRQQQRRHERANAADSSAPCPGSQPGRLGRPWRPAAPPSSNSPRRCGDTPHVHRLPAVSPPARARAFLRRFSTVGASAHPISGPKHPAA